MDKRGRVSSKEGAEIIVLEDCLIDDALDGWEDEVGLGKEEGGGGRFDLVELGEEVEPDGGLEVGVDEVSWSKGSEG